VRADKLARTARLVRSRQYRHHRITARVPAASANAGAAATARWMRPSTSLAIASVAAAPPGAVLQDTSRPQDPGAHRLRLKPQHIAIDDPRDGSDKTLAAGERYDSRRRGRAVGRQLPENSHRTGQAAVPTSSRSSREAPGGPSAAHPVSFSIGGTKPTASHRTRSCSRSRARPAASPAARSRSGRHRVLAHVQTSSSRAPANTGVNSVHSPYHARSR